MRHATFTMLAFSICLSGCVKSLTKGGEKVELLTAPHAQGCEIIKIFKIDGSSPDDDLNKVLNRTAELGGDSVAIADQGQTVSDDYIDAVALRCHEH